jgi:hypothetical protein
LLRYVACSLGRLDVAKWLFRDEYQRGAAADVRTPNNSGCTPLLAGKKAPQLSKV